MLDPPNERELRARNVRAVVIFGLTFVLAAGLALGDLLSRGATSPLRIGLAIVFGLVFGIVLVRWLRSP